MIQFVLKIVYISVWQCSICTDVALFWFHNSIGHATCF